MILKQGTSRNMNCWSVFQWYLFIMIYFIYRFIAEYSYTGAYQTHQTVHTDSHTFYFAGTLLQAVNV